MEASGQLHAPDPSPHSERDPIDPLDKRLGEHQGQPGEVLVWSRIYGLIHFKTYCGYV
jgi:hypothetical protein